MSHAMVTYDTRTGQILLVQYAASASIDLEKQPYVPGPKGAPAEHVARIRIAEGEMTKDKLYRVDLSTKKLVDAGGGPGMTGASGKIPRH